MGPGEDVFLLPTLFGVDIIIWTFIVQLLRSPSS